MMVIGQAVQQQRSRAGMVGEMVVVVGQGLANWGCWHFFQFAHVGPNPEPMKPTPRPSPK